MLPQLQWKFTPTAGDRGPLAGAGKAEGPEVGVVEGTGVPTTDEAFVGALEPATVAVVATERGRIEGGPVVEAFGGDPFESAARQPRPFDVVVVEMEVDEPEVDEPEAGDHLGSADGWGVVTTLGLCAEALAATTVTADAARRLHRIGVPRRLAVRAGNDMEGTSEAIAGAEVRRSLSRQSGGGP
jgi:hypothetical protein